ncbi:MAG: hypothetical protein ACYC0V_01630 [Armatimonadota bacterium]
MTAYELLTEIAEMILLATAATSAYFLVSECFDRFLMHHIQMKNRNCIKKSSD